jgi:hemerythrin-like metal-binding protein
MNVTWYSTLSTGIFEVDEQHSTLDQLLEFITTSDSAQHQSLLRLFLTRLKMHFAYEEELLVKGKPFASEAHASAHRDMERVTEELIERALSAGSLELNSVVSELGFRLMSHVSNYDTPIAIPQ